MDKFSFDKESQKKRKKKKSQPSGFNIVDDDNDFQNQGRQQIDKYRASDHTNVMIDDQGMISINKDLLKTANEDDIKPVIVTDISPEQLQEILEAQKEGKINKARKEKMKEVKKAEKKKAQWIQIDSEGNRVKAIVGRLLAITFLETKEERKEKKRRERKEIKQEVKRRFLEEEARKKRRKQELEEKLLGITAVDEKPVKRRKRHDTDSESEEDDKPKELVDIPKTSLDNMKSGLQSLDDLKAGMEQNKKLNQIDEKDAFDQLKSQQTVYRDKDGKIITDSEMSSLMISKKDKLRQMNQERLNLWSKGIVQTHEKGRDEEELKAKNDGKEYDNLVDQELKQQHRFGDPIKEIRKHQKGKASEKDKQVLWSRKVFPPCPFEAPPNRFDIVPGHRWDGVERGNGFENRFLDQANLHKSNKESFYKWASKDM
jgi:pre-mRNA-splicing factor CWC26